MAACLSRSRTLAHRAANLSSALPAQDFIGGLAASHRETRASSATSAWSWATAVWARLFFWRAQTAWLAPDKLLLQAPRRCLAAPIAADCVPEGGLSERRAGPGRAAGALRGTTVSFSRFLPLRTGLNPRESLSTCVTTFPLPYFLSEHDYLQRA